jgi:hypothetical protein
MAPEPARARPTRGHTVALAGILLLSLLIPAASQARPTWLPPEPVAAGGGNPRVAVDAAGDAIVVWTAFLNPNYVVEASTRPAGGHWSAPVEVGTAATEEVSCDTCSWPDVAMDAAGKAYVIWSWWDSVASTRRILIRTRSPNGAWGKFSVILASNAFARFPHIAMDAAGDAAAVWSIYDGSNSRIQAWFRPVAGTSVPVATISPAGTNAYGGTVAIGGDGTAMATWARNATGVPADGVEQVAVRPAGGDWAAPVDVSTAGAYESALAMNAAGDAVAAWSRIDSGTNATQVEVATRAAGTTIWSASHGISVPHVGGAYIQTPQAVVAPSGAASAVWTGYDGSNSIIYAADGPASGGGWGPPQALSLGTSSASQPQIAIGGNGTTVAAWWRGSVIQTSVRRRGGAWSAPEDLSEGVNTSATPGAVAVDGAGNAVTAWVGYGGAASKLRAAAYDAAGPVFAKLKVPSHGTTGAKIKFRVSPFDVWSPPGLEPIWSFGDGSTAVGTKVSHRYAKKGTYRVTIREADGVGNITTVTRKVRVKRHR